MENIDLVGSLLGSQATISGNLSGVSDQVAFNAAAAVYFGYNAVPAPGAAGMLVGGGRLALRRRRSSHELSRPQTPTATRDARGRPV